MFMLVFAAIGVFGAGMLAIAAGIPIKDFGFGNTLILSGVLAWCTSAIMITLWACFRDLKGGIEKPERRSRDAEQAPAETRAAAPAPAANPPGWPESIPERTPAPPPASPSAPPPAPVTTEQRDPRRNILFSSNRRPPTAQPPRETPRPSEAALQMAPAASPPEPRPTPPEEPRPAPRRVEPPPPRTVRPVSTVGPRDPVSAPPLPPAPSPPPAPPPPQPPAEPPASTVPPERPARSEGGASVTVLKSGVVDGMAYWLFSDGSIEAQMPEGMMRFTSIDELRAHLDKRP